VRRNSVAHCAEDKIKEEWERVAREDEEDAVPHGPRSSPWSEMPDPFGTGGEKGFTEALRELLNARLYLEKMKRWNKEAAETGHLESSDPKADVESFQKELQKTASVLDNIRKEKRRADIERQRRDKGQYS
jgi:hypothetical protein